jgi:hypothetical protein
VRKTRDFATGGQVLDFLLEVPDAVHLAIHFQHQIFADIHGPSLFLVDVE